MKLILILLLSALGLVATAQQPQNLGGANTIVLVGGALKLGDTVAFAPVGSIGIHGGQVYVKSSSGWTVSTTVAKNVQWFGAVGDGVTDDFAAIQAALNAGGTIYFPPTSANYRTSQMLRISQQNTRILGDNRKSKLISDAGVLVTFSNGYNVSNTVIEGMWLKNQATATSGHNSVFLVTMDSLFDHNETRIDSNLSLINNYITGSAGYTSGVFIVSHRSGFGGIVKHVVIDNNTFEGIGSSAIEVLGEYSSLWCSDIRVTNNVFRHSGTQNAADGFACSISGADNLYAVHNKVTDAKTIGIECTVCSYSTISDNVYDSLSYTLTAPYTFNMTGTGITHPGRGNVAIGNRSIDTMAAPPYIINQEGFHSSNNNLKYSATYLKVDSVFNSTFTGDTYLKTGTNNFPVVAIRLHSGNNTFSQCNLVGNNSNDQIVLFASNAAHNIVFHSKIEGNVDYNHLFTADGTTVDNQLKDCYSPTLGLTGIYANMPVASGPTYDLVLDANGNQSILAHGGIGTTFIPTLTNTTNITASVLGKATYTQSGKMIHGSIGGTITPTTSSTLTVLSFSLPVTAGNVTNSIGFGMVTSGTGVLGIVNNTSTVLGTFTFTPSASGSALNFSLTFDYTLP